MRVFIGENTFFVIPFLLVYSVSLYANRMQMRKPANKVIFISLFHDTRREKENGLYPVKLRVFFKTTRKQKLYATKFEFSKKDFQSIWQTVKPREEFKESRKEMQALLTVAETEAEVLHPFTFEVLEKKLFSKSTDSQNVFHWYDLISQQLNDNKRFGSATSYDLSSKSIKRFISHKTGQSPASLDFHDITIQFLQGYETWMISVEKKSITTVGIYLRTLRAVFNAAIDANEIDREIYPFGKRKYKIPASRNIKKALSKETLKKLFDIPPLSFEEERAKDLFFFSYACNGINTKDILELKFENIKGDTLQFIRGKTAHTAKSNLKPTVVYLNDITRGIIEKYSNTDHSPDNYVFPYLSKENSDYENYRRIKNLTSSINQSIKRLAKAAGIKENISTYAARHSFATQAILNGASMEYISEAMSHSNLLTTQNYFAGFEEKDKRLITEKLLQFD
jgi:integrase/recombinase XerD